jgi:hypothetical protein
MFRGEDKRREHSRDDKAVQKNNMTESIKCRLYRIIPITMKFGRF